MPIITFRRVSSGKFSLNALSLALSGITAFSLTSQATAAPALMTYQQQSAQITPATANAWLEIDTKAFESNLATLQQQLNGTSKICAILKADAYGNGINLLMPSVIKMNVPCVGIASNEEARAVRASGYKGEIMRVRTGTLEEIKGGMKYNMQELLGDLSLAQAVNDLAKKSGKTIKYHLALNSTGMDRNGMDMTSEQGRNEAIKITQLPNLRVVGIMSHFPVEDADEVRKNLAVFNTDAAWLIKNAKLDRKKLTLHIANSFATLAVPESHLDMVRPGGLLYGDSIPSHIEYKPTMAFKTKVASINHYPKGSTVGYDRTYTLSRDSMLANLPMGYSDGYRRVFTNKGHVLINGHRVPVVGKVSMNTTMVDVTDFPDILEGSEVVIYGKQGNEQITQAETEDINGALLADLYTVWGNSNPRFKKSY